MSTKLTINLDATALGHSACIRDLYYTIVGELNESGQTEGGYKEKENGPELVYGIALHKFVDVAYKTNGSIPIARQKALDLFTNIPTRDHPKKPWLRDSRHLSTVCMNLWTEYVLEEQSFDLIQLVLPCWCCRGTGYALTKAGLDMSAEAGGGSSIVDCKLPCSVCKGDKQFLQPATEVTFSIKYYEDDYIIINLCGTIDKIGKFRNGCYALGDWKTTGTWDNEGYFQQYELSRQLRMYKLAIRLMSAMHPDSVIGQLGQSNLGVFIDAVFLNKDPNDTKFIRSEVFPISSSDLDAFQLTLDSKIQDISRAVKTGYIPKEGILNGSCIKYQNVSEKNFAKCIFWDVCRTNEQVGAALLKRNFNRVMFDPLKYNEV